MNQYRNFDGSDWKSENRRLAALGVLASGGVLLVRAAHYRTPTPTPSSPPNPGRCLGASVGRGATGVRRVQRATEYRVALRPCAAGGYINFMVDEGGSRGRSTYRDNYDRVVFVKAKYGAENFLSVYRNIGPTATSAAV